MYVTAQRVVSPATKHQGVNAFLYRHGMNWTTSPPADVPEQNPGTLVARAISVSPPGNRVRSYLDIVAPDEATWNEVRAELMTFLGQAQSGSLPWSGSSGRCGFALGVEPSLSRQWLTEFAVLYRTAQALRLANPL